MQISFVKVSQNVMFLLVFLVLAVSAYLILGNAPGEYDDFAKCLTKNDVKMYGAYWCPHCKDQKELFGNSFKYITYVECARSDGLGQTDACNEEGITAYPTWKVNGKLEVGGLSIGDLSSKSGCSIK